MLRSVFVANRGEIASRVIRACKVLELETVLGFSEADRGSLPTLQADRAICIGPGPAAQSYLNIPAIITAAQGSGCDAIHPGYGFLAESEDLAIACQEADLAFIGPAPETLRLAGDKLETRRVAADSGLPVVPGSRSLLNSPAEAAALGRQVGYPLVLKAVGGGGGRGMRVAYGEADLVGAFATAAAEAASAFSISGLYGESYLDRVRHVEIQIVADTLGNTVHLGERDCTVQRRHQKLLEEGPSPVLDDDLRDTMGEMAVALARRIGYVGVGTVEFILDATASEFFFIEVNPRIQVEHPVTEVLTGVDLVVEQLRIAMGHQLGLQQDDVRVIGHAIECRINAEDSDDSFIPTPGIVHEYSPPTGEGIRVDSYLSAGASVPPFYDSLIAKVIAHAPDRVSAISRMRQALTDLKIEGVATTVPFHLMVLQHHDFAQANIHTRWAEEELMTAETA